MPAAVPSDHPTVDSYRLSVGQIGRTGRPELLLPEALTVAEGTVIYLAVGGETAYAEVTSTLGGERAIHGAFANRRLARTEGEGENKLQGWLDDVGRTTGETVVLDVLTPEFAYGLREPGNRLVYEPPDAPEDSLADIARSLGEDSE